MGVLRKSSRRLFRAFRFASDQAISAVTYTTVIYDGVSSSHPEISYNASTGVATLNRAGIWMITAVALVNTNDGTRVAGNVYINGGAGGQVFKTSDHTVGAAGQANASGTVILSLAAGTTVEYRVYSSVATSIIASGTETYWTIVRLEV